MSHASTITDVSEREDVFNAAFCHLNMFAPIPLDDDEMGELMSHVSGQGWIYIQCGKLAIIEHFDKVILNSEQPYKDILETVIDNNGSITVYDHLKASLV